MKTRQALKHPGLTDAETSILLTLVIAELESRSITLEQMTVHRHRLFRVVSGRVNELDKQDRKQTCGMLLSGDAVEKLQR